jgi:ketosteroid isomerase-like protein
MPTPDNLRAILEKLYSALCRGDVATWLSLHSESAVFNIGGNTIISGQVPLQQLLTEVFPLVFDPLKPETVRFGLRWKLMCADDRRATVIFEGESTTRTGQPYNNRYRQILEFGDNGLIQQVWELFDTDLANSALFDPSGHQALNTRPFSY